MEKECPRCGKIFVCNHENITQCQCASVILSEVHRRYITEHYADCLCVNCLREIQNMIEKKKSQLIILEKPYVSECLVDFAIKEEIAVLANDFALTLTQSRCKLNLCDEKDIFSSGLEKLRLYTVSENALEWLYDNFKDSDLVRKINLMKNKADFRRLCKKIYPDFLFEEFLLDDLFSLDIQNFTLPFVLKPSVGFISAGVYIIRNKKDWEGALSDIRKNFGSYKDVFPSSVIEGSRFLLEEYIQGEEFAVDAYMDELGKPVILNIFHHRFSSSEDVSDRLYSTSKFLFDTYREKFESFLLEMNALLELKNFPLHIEFRVDGDRIIPIEINPMRFAGMCLNELALYIGGVHPVKCFLENIHPDYEKMWENKEEDIFSFIVLDQSPDLKNKKMDFEKILKHFSNVLEIRKVDNPKLNIFGFLFTKTSRDNLSELDFALTADWGSFCKS